jgi:hypothetical protein
MAQVPGSARSKFAGLYAWLLAREERAAALGGTLVDRDKGIKYTGNPARLAALRAGETVDMSAWSIPAEARPGVRCQATRAVIGPDGAVTFRPETAAEVLADLGL